MSLPVHSLKLLRNHKLSEINMLQELRHRVLIIFINNIDRIILNAFLSF